MNSKKGEITKREIKEVREAFSKVARFIETASDDIYLARQSMIALKSFSWFKDEYKAMDDYLKQIHQTCEGLGRMMRAKGMEVSEK